MATEEGIPEAEVRRLQVAASLHDVGKLHIPSRILGAPRRLTTEEFDLMKNHPVWGEEIVRALGYSSQEGFDRWPIADVAPWVRHHHERVDGKGYPDGLVGDEIPVQSRMVFVADAFHVMTSNRPYQRSKTRIQALQELVENAGTQFCPRAVSMLTNRGRSDEAREIYDALAQRARKLADDNQPLDPADHPTGVRDLPSESA